MVEAKIKALRDELERHNYNYYVLSAPTISDFEFDKMMKELQELEAAHPEFADPDSPTRRVGSDLSKEFEQVVHNNYNYAAPAHHAGLLSLLRPY